MQENPNTPKNGETNKIDSDAMNASTRDFNQVETTPKSDSGATKTFDTVDVKKKKKSKKEMPVFFRKIKNFVRNVKKLSEDLRKKKKRSKTVRAAKATARSVWFVARKVLTYTLNVLLTILVIGIITGAVVVLAFIVYIKNYVDPNYTGLDNLKFDSALSTTMYYVDDKGNEVLLENDTLESSENRLWADYDDIPQILIDAYIAVEDQRFYEHPGVDTTRTASAIYNFFIPTSSSYGGGSTITQQLIKNVTGENDTTIQRKVQEIFRALNVEKKFSKSEILEMYLNTIYLSHNSYGVRVAAKTYFGKELNELTLNECAAIASIGKWPIHYDPISNPQNNLERRNLVLKLMLEQEMITQEEFDANYDTPLKLAEGSDEEYSETIHSYYIDAVMDDVISDLMDEYGYDETTAANMLFSGGLQIVTCLDPAIQACAEKVFENKDYWPSQNGMQAQAAICIMDPETGDLLAIVGGLGEKRESRGFNRATHATRQCGSSIKPISVYAYALDSGLYTAGSPIDDVPQTFYSGGGYWPSNAGRGYRGVVSLDYSIQSSMNTTAVATLNKLGAQAVFENMLGYGYTTLVSSRVTEGGEVLTDIGAPQLALGGLTDGVTVREHTQAYATLANSGMTSKARTYSEVRDSTGKVILDNKEEHTVKYKESTAAVMTELLTHVVNGWYGTAGGFVTVDNNYGIEVAGKTGTTDNTYDAYFCGYTPDLVGCVWYGYDYNKTVSGGSRSPGSLWNHVFNEIYKYYEKNDIDYQKRFEVPASVVEGVEYCSISGKLATKACRNDLYAKNGGMSCIWHGTFSVNDVPTEYCDAHVLVKYDKKTKAVCVDGCQCPEGDIIEVGLRKITFEDRDLKSSLTVADAQYLYMEVPANYVYPTSSKVPFYYNLLPKGQSYIFGNYGSAPANRVCTKHYDPDADESEESEDPNTSQDPNVSQDPNTSQTPNTSQDPNVSVAPNPDEPAISEPPTESSSAAA